MYEDMKAMFKKMAAWVKGVWASWTIRWNAFLASVVVAVPMFESQFPQLKEFLPGTIYDKAMLVIVGINILLRMKTSKPLTERAPENK